MDKMKDNTEILDKISFLYSIAQKNYEEISNILDDCYRFTRKYYKNEIKYYENTNQEQERYFSKNSEVYNNIAINGLKKYAGQAQQALFPQDLRWGSIKETTLLQTYLKQNGQEHKLKKFLDRATEMFFDYLNESNFHVEILNVLKDLGISTGVLYIEQGTPTNPINWKHIPIWEIRFTVDRWNKAKDIFWIDFLYPEQLKMLLQVEINEDSSEDSSMENDIRVYHMSLLDEYKTDTKLKVIHAYLRNDDQYTYTRYIYIDDIENKKLIQTKFFNVCPFIVARMNLNSGNAYGNGVVMDNLDSIILLNSLSKRNRMLASSELMSTRLIRKDKLNLKEKTENESGETIIPIKEGNDTVPMNEIIKDVQINQDIVNQILKEKELSEELKKEFVYQSLGGLENIGKATATETEIREKEFEEHRAGEYARLKTEVAVKIFEMGLNILFNLGLLDNIAEDLEESLYSAILEKKNIMIKIQYKSPLSKLNDREDLIETDNVLNLIRSKVGDIVYTAYIDQLKLAKYMINKSGISTDITRSDKEIEELNPAKQENK